jgi:hypothetical protein
LFYEYASRGEYMNLINAAKKPLTPIVFCVLFTLFALPVWAQYGTIRELSGAVELKHDGARNFRAARVNDILAPNAVISTGFRGSATIAVGSAIITMQPLTRLILTEIAADQQTETIGVRLAIGRVRVDIAPSVGTNARFRIKSLTADASAMGASFELDARNLYVIDGPVQFRGRRGAAVRVSSGGSSSANSVTGRAAAPLIIQKAALLPSRPAAGPFPRDGAEPSGPLWSSLAPVADYDISIDIDSN